MASPYSTAPSTGEEFVEVTLDIEDDETIILRSVEPAGTVDSDLSSVAGAGISISSVPGVETSATSMSRSPTMRRASSSRLRQFSAELKAEISRAKQSFSAQLTKRFSWSHGFAAKILSRSPSLSGLFDSGGVDPAIAARARRRQLAQLNRTRSGAQKALKGLRFISSKGNVTWKEVERNFERLAKDGFLYRSDFAECIGSLIHLNLNFFVI